MVLLRKMTKYCAGIHTSVQNTDVVNLGEISVPDHLSIQSAVTPDKCDIYIYQS